MHSMTEQGLDSCNHLRTHQNLWSWPTCSRWTKHAWEDSEVATVVYSSFLAIPHSAVLLHSLDGMTMWDFCVSVFSLFLFLPYQYLSWYNAVTSPSSIVTELDRRSLSTLLFRCVFGLFGCVCVCSVAFGVVWLFAVFLEWNRDDGWTMYRSYTSSLLWPTTNGGHLYALIS